MSTDTENETDSRPKVLPWVVGIVAAVVVAVVGFALLDSNEGDVPPLGSGQDTVTRLTMSAPQGRCMPPDATTLAQAAIAFSGSVVSVSKDVVTLKPSAWYAGDHTDLVTVEQVDPGLTNLVGAVEFRPGEDYLVAANDGAVMVCGFSGEESSDLTALYQQAFSGGNA